MKFQAMRDFIAECTDSSSLEIPEPSLAVQLRSHPASDVMKRRIHDDGELRRWFANAGSQVKDRPEYSKCIIMADIVLSPEQKQFTRAGRAMVIGIVAAFDEMMAAAEKGGYKEPRDWIDKIQFLQLVSSQGILTLGALQSSETFRRFHRQLMSEFEVIAVALQDAEFTTMINNPATPISGVIQKLRVNVLQYLTVNRIKLLDLFKDRSLEQEDENFRMVQQVVNWVLNPAHNLSIGKARQDLERLRTGVSELPEDPVHLTGVIDAFNLAWLIAHGTFEFDYSSLALERTVQEQRMREFNLLLTGEDDKIRLAEKQRLEEDAAHKLLNCGVSEELFHRFTPQFQQDLIESIQRQLITNPMIEPMLEPKDFDAIARGEPKIFAVSK